MKQLIWKSLLLLFILLQWPTVAAEASSPEAEGAQDMSSKWIQQQVDALETDSIEQYWNDLGREYAQYFPGQELPSITDMMFTDDQQSAFSGWGIIKGFIRFF